MLSIFQTLIAIGMMIVLAIVVAGLLNVLRGGLSRTDEYLRCGVSFSSMLNGSVPNSLDGSTINLRDGLRASTNENGELKIIGTNTTSRDSL